VQKARNRSLLSWIIGFKAVKAIALVAVGITLLVTRDEDPAYMVVRLALALHLPLTSRLFDRAFSTATTLTVGKQIALAVTAFAYAGLMGSEGITLYLRKPWARWFTIIATTSLIPIEIYEIAREPTVVRVLILLLNVGIVLYLWR
jgi:uncharacterized membrane protein (DUF2068 family)